MSNRGFNSPNRRSLGYRDSTHGSGSRRPTSALGLSGFRDLRGTRSESATFMGKDPRWHPGSAPSSSEGKNTSLLSARTRGLRGATMTRKSSLTMQSKAFPGSISKTSPGINIQGRKYKKGSAAGRSSGRLPDFYSNPNTPRENKPYKSPQNGIGGLPSVSNPSRYTAGAGATSLSQIQPADEDGVIFAVSQKAPGVPFVYRSQTSRMVSPERLNLDRRNLTVCPILEGEEQLRLLNFENNNIVRISNLKNLPNLIFLDLYNNQIKEISGLRSLCTLRVLMLGKNYITKIENLESLLKLDVLDLHSNRIGKIQNLAHLRDLRVLNLAGNQINIMENLEGLSSLTELNLRRNGIHTVLGLEQCSALHRVFLSDNKISSFDSLESLFRLKSLGELTLDGNPVATNRYYREYLVDRIKTLRALDMRRVTEEEKRVATMVIKNDENLERQRREHLKAERTHSISAIEHAWHSRHKRQSKDRKSLTLSRSGSPKGYFEVKDKVTLLLYGNALEMLTADMRLFQEREKIETIEIYFYDVSFIIDNMNKLKRFSNATTFVLRHNDIKLFRQLDPFSACNIQNLLVTDNKICSISLFRLYLIFKLPSLKVLNRVDISEEEREIAQRKFGPVSSIPMKHLEQVLSKRRDKNTVTLKEGSKSRKIARQYVDKVVQQVLAIDKKVHKFHSIWPSIVNSIVRSTLSELEASNLNEDRENEERS
eukprot:CAMPEP_0184498622 /NCGR_PEP_ID=MMETSP0113_2-20130426/39426_1 /TAXON_ID=91329 /ORGANISM="Norrisiella sphaerica, Strain BC52" /LENGTH=710 /DNA_ID=CAMNT_0026886221 /DNA_START=113 /DNA_END=2245 /DNA_ORIENTATION=-